MENAGVNRSICWGIATRTNQERK